MGFHTFPIERADKLDDPARFRFCSREELLELLDPSATDSILDLGSGTGFFSAEVAPFIGQLYAIDVQPAMHYRHRENGVPSNTHLVTAAISALPLEDNSLNGAFSIMTHHEYATAESMAEIERVIRPGGRFVLIDWSRTGDGNDGPPVEERYSPKTIVDQLQNAGFDITTVRERPETVAVCAIVVE